MGSIAPYGIAMLGGLSSFGLAWIFADYAEHYFLSAGGYILFYGGLIGLIFMLLPIKLRF
jgi:hypothetical protein